MSIIVGADIVPTSDNIKYFEKSCFKELIGDDLHKIFKQADCVIANLEVPLTDIFKPINKNGPNLIASRKSVVGIRGIGINLVTLSNNHIMDQDTEGLYSTLEVLERSGISYVGAGKNINEAKKPFYFIANGKKYGVYACAEHEFSIAGRNKPGANPFDQLTSLDHINDVSNNCDFTIVLYHGGKEHYRYPSPYLRYICKRMIEKGANLVICQHSHCIGCKEEYLSGTIVYGQGNFIFKKYNNEYWNTGLLIDINNDNSINYLPIVTSKYGIKLANRIESEEIINSFYRRSMEILEPGIVEQKYRQFANNTIVSYLLCFLGINNNLLLRVLNKLSHGRATRILANQVLKKNRIEIYNYIKCESHRELLLYGLEMDYDELP